MDISTETERTCLIVRLKGELDMHSVPKFKEKVIKIMGEKDLKNLILNLKNVNFVDSTGLGAILGRYRYLDNKDGQVILVALKPQVKRVFELSGMMKLMPTFNSEADALKRLNHKGGYKYA